MVMTGLFNRSTDQFKVFSCFLPMSKVDFWCIHAWGGKLARWIQLSVKRDPSWNSVSVFGRFWTRYFGIFQFFLRYCGISVLGPPPKSETPGYDIRSHRSNWEIYKHCIDNGVNHWKWQVSVRIKTGSVCSYCTLSQLKLREAISLGNRKVGSFCRYRHQKRIKGTEQ